MFFSGAFLFNMASWSEMKVALLNGALPVGLKTFDTASLVQYFMNVKCDPGNVKGPAYQMFKRGYVQVCVIHSTWKYQQSKVANFYPWLIFGSQS